MSLGCSDSAVILSLGNDFEIYHVVISYEMRIVFTDSKLQRLPQNVN